MRVIVVLGQHWNNRLIGRIGSRLHLHHIILMFKKKIYSTNELELLAVVWSVDRFKHYLLGKEFILATDHKALTSALGEHKYNKTYQSRLTRWVDRLFPFQFKVVHISGKNMGIVDYLSGEPSGEPWPESELDKNLW